MTITLNRNECLDFNEDCQGRVEYRMALSGSGRSFPRCSYHWDERLKVQEEINERYPDSPSPPDWFDPAYAGETWSEEE